MDRLGPFAPDRAVVVAVSGGADSMALAVLCARWGKPMAAVVDHGLRASSAAEAALTAERLARLGIPARILPAGLVPGPAAAERAREARHRLLLLACRDAGRTDLLFAHHRADAEETVAMRGAAGSAAAGLAGIPALAYRDEARLLRPLLEVAPERLRATLVHAGVQWVEDPSNHDLRTGRGALRRSLGDAERVQLRESMGVAAAARATMEAAVARALAGTVLRPEGFALVEGPLAPDALSALLWALSGRAYPPSRASLAAGLAPRTLAGLQISPARRLGPGVIVAREPGAVAPPVPAEAGVRWDGRWRLGFGDRSLWVGALGGDARRFGGRSALPARLRVTLPAVRHGDRLLCVPALGFPDPAACARFPIVFAPRRPAAPAPFR